MIEIFSIFTSLFSLFLFFNFPVNFFLINKVNKLQLTFNESLLINIIFNSNILLLFSFFSIHLTYIFFVFVISSLFLTLRFYKEYIILVKNNFYLIISFLVIFYSMSILLVKNAYLEWDALAHWIHKATVYFQGGAYKNLSGLPFDYYPHLGSYIWAFFWKNSLLQIEYSGRLFYIFIFLVSIFALKNKLTKKYSEFEKIIIIFIIIFLSTNFFLFGGYQEYFLFFVFFTFSHFFIKFFYSNKINLYFIPEIFMILITFCIMWIKQEGFFYYLILNLIFIVHSNISIKRKILYFSFVLLLVYLFYTLKTHYFGLMRFNDSIINNETFKNLDIFYMLSKVVVVSKYFLISFFKYPIWLMVLLSIFILHWKFSILREKKFITTYLILIFGFIFSIFLNTTDNVEWLAPLTLNRIVFATVGFLIFLNIDLLNKVREKV